MYYVLVKLIPELMTDELQQSIVVLAVQNNVFSQPGDVSWSGNKGSCYMRTLGVYFNTSEDVVGFVKCILPLGPVIEIFKTS